MCNKMPQNPPETLYELESSKPLTINNFMTLNGLHQSEQVDGRYVTITYEMDWTVPATECEGVQDTFDMVMLLAHLKAHTSACDFTQYMLGHTIKTGKHGVTIEIGCDGPETGACSGCFNRVHFTDEYILYCPLCKHKLSEPVMLSALQEIKEKYPALFSHEDEEGSE